MEAPSKSKQRHNSADDLAAVLDALGIPVLELNVMWFSPLEIDYYVERIEVRLGLKVL